jgi:hypothetical protein
MKKTKRLLPIILTIATVLTATCAFAACFFGDKPEEAVTDTQEATLIMEKAVEKMIFLCYNTQHEKKKKNCN